jgi:hypothetical protein
MTGDPPALSRFELAARELRALGIVMTRLPGEYRVNYRTGTTKPSAREARQTIASHDAEGDATPHDPPAHTDACARDPPGARRKNRNLLTGRRQGASQFGTTRIKADCGLQAI